MSSYNITYKSFGKRAILIEWNAIIDENVLQEILSFKNLILKNKHKVILDIISTYNSITIFYQFTIENIYNEIIALKSIYEESDLSNVQKNKLWKIPVCYDPYFGLDLEELSVKKKLTISEIIEIHSKPVYTIFFIGFLPGFLYLGGLNETLHFPRKSIPRLRVDRGAVGIGSSQTGIYPQESAGGWNIIGNSPILFFDRKREEPCFAKPGDKVQFVPIDRNEHTEILNLVAYKRYAIESEVLNA